VDFLKNTIVFNPNKRSSIDETLNHPLFARVRNPASEIVTDEPIVLDFEDKEVTFQELR